MSRTRFIAIASDVGDAARDDSAVSVLRQLGAEVRVTELFSDGADLFGDDETAEQVSVLCVDPGARLEIAPLVLRALRREPRLARTSTILVVAREQVARLDPAWGFDDFVMTPVVAAELYARVRVMEWKTAEFSTRERTKIGNVVVDRASRDVTVSGRVIQLTSKEFRLLCYLAERRGRAVSREELLERVWGSRYDGGSRTVDIHITRLRSKLHGELPLVTVRGAGYKLRSDP